MCNIHSACADADGGEGNIAFLGKTGGDLQPEAAADRIEPRVSFYTVQ
jgi:hypothetical protein